MVFAIDSERYIALRHKGDNHSKDYTANIKDSRTQNINKQGFLNKGILLWEGKGFKRTVSDRGGDGI